MCKHEYMYMGNERRQVKVNFYGMIGFDKKQVRIFICKFCLKERVKV